jgi:hypothetical protein
MVGAECQRWRVVPGTRNGICYLNSVVYHALQGTLYAGISCMPNKVIWGLVGKPYRQPHKPFPQEMAWCGACKNCPQEISLGIHRINGGLS